MPDKAVIFDFNGVLDLRGGLNEALFEYIATLEVKTAIYTTLDNMTLRLFLVNRPPGLFDEKFTRDSHAYTKPAVEGFALAAKMLGIIPENCLMIDDSAQNVAGAEEAGMKAWLFTDTETTIQQIKDFLA